MHVESNYLIFIELHNQDVEIGVRYEVDSSTKNPVADRMRVLLKMLHDMDSDVCLIEGGSGY